MKTAAIAEFTKNSNMNFEFTLQNPASQSMPSEGILSNREVTIVQCLAQGKSSQEIAKELFISHFTVKTHRKNILSKTGARNVAHLVQLALAHRWI